MSKIKNLKEFLDEKVLKYNTDEFIESDPISIPHLFKDKKDIEVSGFLTATISWGRRVAIIKKAKQLMAIMDHAPYDFVVNYTDEDIKKLDKFVYRTFNSLDLCFFLKSLKNIYLKYGGLENLFCDSKNSCSIKERIVRFRNIFLSLGHIKRTEKHVSNPVNGSASKRLNMFLRWMVRSDKKVDIGIWKSIDESSLMCPLDVHCSNVGRHLGLIRRKQNNWDTVVELTDKLRSFDSQDPIKYDFALFGLGLFENYKSYESI